MEKVQQQKTRNRMVVMRMNEVEYQRLQKLQRQTTEKYLSNYLRKQALQKPVIVHYRNQSADDFLKQMLLLKKELNAVGNNFNQAVKKLHLLEKIPEFRSWILAHQQMQQKLLGMIEQIRIRLNEVYELWLQK